MLVNNSEVYEYDYELQELEEKELCGEKFKVMKEWHKFLTIVYGDYMVPKKY